ncbi:hypothetical protein CONPUDRAFT_115565 [Coniophora puteana RWD-64-598 SS2]|uniref:RNA-dependent RNA polymerase n=1 Tax=Coniophora puteana (strain RWD-64-598) TaxID=741705 RepID=A0A5M3N5X8_CONPW|nr:uncharacterized protein CONPUDRAFT_115565 [Coniophora puteana RWD-64-598 SS2]EIW86830.1 hypothetical protein CONPUDRAFT_115565 [Coniophora puteana RWD-64-598 SS2]
MQGKPLKSETSNSDRYAPWLQDDATAQNVSHNHADEDDNNPCTSDLLGRDASYESLSSTQSSIYSGLEDITQAIVACPDEYMYPRADTSNALTELSSSNNSSDVSKLTHASPPKTTPSSAGAASPRTNQSSLGKRKATEDDSLGLVTSPSKYPRTDTADREGVHVIAHNGNLQKAFDARSICYGVQWLIAMLHTNGRKSYSDIRIPLLDQMKGTNCDVAPDAIRQLYGKLTEGSELQNTDSYFAKERAVTSPWKQLDLEEDYVSKVEIFEGFHRQSDGWYGGKVRFLCTLKENESQKLRPSTSPTARWKIILQRPETGPSSRFTRQFGSKNFIRVRIERRFLSHSEELRHFFSQRFLLCGVIYRAFYAKDGNVFLVATDETADGSHHLPLHARSIPPPSLADFLSWHNPIRFNAGQTLAKWTARFALGLSNSVPGLTLEQYNIFELPDTPGPSDMTDGCGYINRAAMRKLREILPLESVPTAIQCRIAGAKGLLLMHPDDRENDATEPKVWLRTSQIKIRYPSGQSLASGQRTIDVLRTSHMKTPSRLSPETIINLGENGVPHQIFVDLLKKSLDESVDPLLSWEGPKAMEQLWFNISQVGRVFAARLSREAGGEARVMGYSAGDLEDDNEEDLDPVDPDAPRSAAWWADEISGCPSSLEETAMALLDSGFTPQECPVLRDKLTAVVKSTVDRHVARYKLDVPMSCIAWMVPDPFGILAPDEVHIRSSQDNLLQKDGSKAQTVLGSVLLTRHPCKLPTDVQKVTAVQRGELAGYTDVIVCSIQGDRRFADLLAGGDYDGDKAIVIWEPTIINTFRNADLKFSKAPEDLMSHFLKENITVEQFLEGTDASGAGLVHGMQIALLAGLEDSSAVGKYSNFHDIAIYELGYTHETTIRLAYMFCNVLDGAKTGLRVRPEVFTLDSARFVLRTLAWKEVNKSRGVSTAASNSYPAKRALNTRTFVMDVLLRKGKEYRDQKLAEMERKMKSFLSRKRDVTLSAPWEDAQHRANKLEQKYPGQSNPLREELDIIQHHVEQTYKLHKERVDETFSEKPITRRQDILRSLSQQLASLPKPEDCLVLSAKEIARLRASCLYLYDHHKSGKGWSRIPWDLAMRELSCINCEGTGKPVQGSFYAKFAMKQSLLKD